MIIELIGGPFDGDVFHGHPELRDELIATRCPRHGDHPASCECEDVTAYGYYREPGKGAGHFIERKESLT